MSNGDELTHLLPAHRPYALLAAAERVDWIRQERWIQYTRAEEALARLGELLDYPPHDRMPAMLLFGATGMGKTRLLQRFLREHGGSFDPRCGTTGWAVAPRRGSKRLPCSRRKRCTKWVLPMPLTPISSIAGMRSWGG
jgi:hypothetical protein